VGFAAIIVWVADWTSGARYVALADLNRRIASGEIDQPEYVEKRKSAGKIRPPRNGATRRKREKAGACLPQWGPRRFPAPWSIEGLGAC
jgi:hypothetical protein